MIEALQKLVSLAGLELGGLQIDELASVLGALLIVIGVLILAYFALGRLSSETEKPRGSRLLPTLAEDVLDADLRRVYRQSLWLDALAAKRLDAGESTTGSRLGRNARRALVDLQIRRYSARQTQRGEPPQNEARLADIQNALLEAIDALEPASDGVEVDARKLEAILEKIAERLQDS